MTEQEIKEMIFGEDQSSEEEQFSGENGTAGKVSTNDGDNTENVEKPSPDEEHARAEINTGIRIISASDRGDELLRKAFGLAG
ncbi:MAG: hypothetical protein II782_09575 [Oscillospiraceae bacterium]|nr:hypothetical protein [Oscillospiraceae bacterium]